MKGVSVFKWMYSVCLFRGTLMGVALMARLAYHTAVVAVLMFGCLCTWVLCKCVCVRARVCVGGWIFGWRCEDESAAFVTFPWTPRAPYRHKHEDVCTLSRTNTSQQLTANISIHTHTDTHTTQNSAQSKFADSPVCRPQVNTTNALINISWLPVIPFLSKQCIMGDFSKEEEPK